MILNIILVMGVINTLTLLAILGALERKADTYKNVSNLITTLSSNIEKSIRGLQDSNSYIIKKIAELLKK